MHADAAKHNAWEELRPALEASAVGAWGRGVLSDPAWRDLLACLQAQVGVTPERARAEQQRLVAAASEAQAVADAHAERARRLEAVLSFEVGKAGWCSLVAGHTAAPGQCAGRYPPVGGLDMLALGPTAEKTCHPTPCGQHCRAQPSWLARGSTAPPSPMVISRRLGIPPPPSPPSHPTHLRRLCLLQERERLELAEFTALEHGILTEAQRVVASEAAQWRADAQAAATQLADARGRLVETDAALLQRDEEVSRRRGCQGGVESRNTGPAELKHCVTHLCASGG